MKNRKAFIGIVLLIVVLLLGIGYAAITKNLEINGTASATVDDSNFSVVFTGETTPATPTDGVTATATEGETTATLNVEGLTTTGQSKSASFKVQNTSDELKATVEATTSQLTGANAGFFSIETEVTYPDGQSNLAPDAEATVTVTVTLEKTPIEAVSATIDVDLTATAVLAD